MTVTVNTIVPEDVKAKHPNATELVIKTGTGEIHILVRPPKRDEYKRFLAQALDQNKKLDAMENLLGWCTVYPDADGLNQLLDLYPAVAPKLAEKTLDLAGASVSVEKKD